MTVAQGTFHCPAVAILLQDVLCGQRQVGAEKGFDPWWGLALCGLFGPLGGGAP
jgi:hypothetical protein